jgi:hypothetical protein
MTLILFHQRIMLSLVIACVCTVHLPNLMSLPTDSAVRLMELQVLKGVAKKNVTVVWTWN